MRSYTCIFRVFDYSKQDKKSMKRKKTTLLEC